MRREAEEPGASTTTTRGAADSGGGSEEDRLIEEIARLAKEAEERISQPTSDSVTLSAVVS